MKLLVRNGDAANPRTGVDWRAVAPLGLLALAVTSGSATLAVNLMTERSAVLQHVARGDALIVPVRQHLADHSIHTDDIEKAMALERAIDNRAKIDEALRRLDRIERKIDAQGRDGR